MERIMTVEEKIRRAEEIYARRHEADIPKARTTATVSLNSKQKKDVKLLKKMLMQILISLFIYIVFYAVQNNNYIFSEDFLNQANKILSYDMNFAEIYSTIKSSIETGLNSIKEKNTNTNENEEKGENENQEAIGGAEGEENQENIQDIEQQSSEEESILTEEDKQIAKIKETTTFIKPVEGKVSSKYGQRDPTTSTVPKNHTGTDIAAAKGTKIKSATEGEVVLSSEEGDYGKHLKIQIGEVSVIYAHCDVLYVKQGDIVTQGQEIAEVGSTGNSTGPHLHFEIRISENTIDPEKILQL